MTLIQAIKIIEALTGKTVTSIRYSFGRERIIYQLDGCEDQFLDLN